MFNLALTLGLEPRRPVSHGYADLPDATTKQLLRRASFKSYYVIWSCLFKVKLRLLSADWLFTLCQEKLEPKTGVSPVSLPRMAVSFIR
jgi:hypothetical protein